VREIFEAHLSRVEWGALKAATRLYPFVYGDMVGAKPIVIDPTIAFGRPVIARAFVSTQSIVERIDAGEEIAGIAADYDVTVDAVKEAVVFERAA
jgi:uncharacterized protein (DUF433 family)